MSTDRFDKHPQEIVRWSRRLNVPHATRFALVVIHCDCAAVNELELHGIPLLGAGAVANQVQCSLCKKRYDVIVREYKEATDEHR